MSFKLIADTFSVARDSDHFVQLKNLKKPRSGDQIWLAIEIVGDSKYARSTTQSIIDTMEDEFFEKSELNIYERFEKSLKEVNIIINSLKEKRKKSFGQVNAIIAVFSGDELHLTQCNSAEAYLIRNNKFSMISEGLDGRSEDLFVNIASGELRSDDKLLFSTARLLRLATHSQIVQLFSDGVAEAVEATRELIIGDEEISLGVIAIHTKLIQKSTTQPSQVSNNKYLLEFKKIANKVFNFVMDKIGKKKSNVDKKNILIAIGAGFVILVLSITFLMNSQRDKAVREEYRLKITNLHQQLQVANTKGYANGKEEANTILTKVEKESRDILAANYFRPEALALLEKVQDARDNINNTSRLKKVAPYIDLTKKDSSVKTVGFVNLDDNFYVYEFSRLFKVILDQVLDPKVIDSNEIILAGSSMEDYDILVFLTKSGRIIEYNNGQVKFAGTADQAWRAGIDIASYGKNIYILSPEKNQIYKYSRLRTQYSSGAEYNTDADLKNAISMTVDGNIYILNKGGTIVKIYKSKQEPFKVEDMAVSIADATQIFTSPQLDNLYLLDPKNKRVVILDKSKSGISRYYGQIVFDKLDNIKEIYVEDSEKKLYILTDKEIYKTDI